MNFPQPHYLRAALNWNTVSSRLSPTPSAFAREHLIYIQEIGYFETSPGYLTERTGLDSLLLMLSVGGTGELRYRDQTHAIQEGDLVWIDCREYHYYQTDPTALWKFYWVHVTGANCQAYFRYFDEAMNGRPVLSLTEPGVVGDLFRDLLITQTSRGIQAEFHSARQLCNLMSEVISATLRQPDARSTWHPAVREAITRMENRMGDPVDLAELAQLGHVSRYYLIKLFVRQTGLTPMNYLQQIRISEAKRLLQQTDWTIERIGETVGLNPSSYLIAVFRQIEGVTPGQYRKRWLNRIR